jgi:hypothetical protein
MAIVLASGLKHNGKFFAEGTPIGDLPKDAAVAAKEHGIFTVVVDEVDIEAELEKLDELIPEEEELDEDDDDEDDDSEEEDEEED